MAIAPEYQIDAMIGIIRRQWVLRETGLLCLVGLAAVIGWVLAAVVTDNLAMLTAKQLVLAWVVLLVGILGLGTLGLFKLSLRRPAVEGFALMYEARVPGVRNRLINAVQFLFDERYESDSLVQAAVAENAGSLDPKSAREAVAYRPVRNAAIVCGVLLLLLIAYAALRPAWTANALGRLLHPFQPGPHLLATDPEVTPGNISLVEGHPLKIEAQIRTSLRGHVARKVDLEYRVGNLDWTVSPMAGGGGTYTYDFPAVQQTMVYRVRADRSVSPDYDVRVLPRPKIEHLQVVVSRPAYAGGASRELKPETGDVNALMGSIVEVRITASTELSKASLELPDGKRITMQLKADRRQAVGQFDLTRSGSYAIRLADAHDLENLPPPRYALMAEPDSPPVPIVRTPGRDLVMPINTDVPLAIEADDDIGLARVAVQVRAGSAAWKDLQQWEIRKLEVRHYSADAYLSLGSLGVKVGDVVLYRAVAEDRRPPQPNLGIGRTWSITVAEPNDSGSLLGAQARHLLEALQRILALQRENRSGVDMDRPVEPLRPRQDQIRQLTLVVIDEQRKSLKPVQSAIDELTALADGPMLVATQALAKYTGTYEQRVPLKGPLLKVMDEIITRLEALIGKIDKSLASADRAQKALEPLSPEEREQALKRVRDVLEKLRDFIPEQDKVIEDTQELVRKGDDLTDKDLQKMEQLKGTEDKWEKAFTDSVKDINKLTEQGFADRTVADDYAQMVEQIEEASKNLHPKLVEMAVPREQSGREMAQTLAEDMEMWLPNSPDHIKWMMEEPLDKPEIPMPELPDQLKDFIGDLIEEQDELNDAADDMTSAWADSMSAAGWEASDGPISNFSAKGVTGNQLPENNELSGRAGDGRSGRSQGQFIGDTAKGLAGRKTPTRVTNDAYEQGVVKELQQMATGGATGGGKARGAGQEGLQGQSPPPLMDNMQFMKDWQQRVRQKAERVAGQLQQVRVTSPELQRSIELMKQAEKAAADGRYQDLFKLQQMVLSQLKMAGDFSARETALRVDRAYHLPPDQRKQILDGMDEPVPQEYEDAVRRYFQQLSETK